MTRCRLWKDPRVNNARSEQVSDLKTKPGVPVVRALDRGIALLKAFTPPRPRQTLTDLARAADLDMGTARRLLQTLVLAGLVEHDNRTALYSLSASVLEIAAAVHTGRELREVAAPYLSDIAETCGATAFLWVYHDGVAVCTERVRAAHPNIDVTWFTVGSRTPLNCGGGPRTLLAFISPDEREVALKRHLIARTGSSETDPAALRKAAEHIRSIGFELAIDDFVSGLAAVGVPIFDRSGTLAGSMSITSLTAQIVDNGRPRHLDLLLSAAQEIGRRLI
jgi:DNA-binding IclR family transcriptional regulator